MNENSFSAQFSRAFAYALFSFSTLDRWRDFDGGRRVLIKFSGDEFML